MSVTQDYKHYKLTREERMSCCIALRIRKASLEEMIAWNQRRSIGALADLNTELEGVIAAIKALEVPF